MTRATRHAASIAATRSAQRIRAQQQAARTAAGIRTAEAMTEQTRIARYQVYMLQDGAEIPGDLAELAWMLAIGACTSMSLHGPDSPLTRRLHGALRSVHAMALDGYRWRAAQAASVEIALSDANDIIRANADIAADQSREADWLAQRIKTRTTEPGDVAGAEVYAAAARSAA